MARQWRSLVVQAVPDACHYDVHISLWMICSRNESETLISQQYQKPFRKTVTEGGEVLWPLLSNCFHWILRSLSGLTWIPTVSGNVQLLILQAMKFLMYMFVHLHKQYEVFPSYVKIYLWIRCYAFFTQLIWRSCHNVLRIYSAVCYVYKFA